MSLRKCLGLMTSLCLTQKTSACLMPMSHLVLTTRRSLTIPGHVSNQEGTRCPSATLEGLSHRQKVLFYHCCCVCFVLFGQVLLSPFPISTC